MAFNPGQWNLPGSNKEPSAPDLGPAAMAGSEGATAPLQDVGSPAISGAEDAGAALKETAKQINQLGQTDNPTTLQKLGEVIKNNTNLMDLVSPNILRKITAIGGAGLQRGFEQGVRQAIQGPTQAAISGAENLGIVPEGSRQRFTEGAKKQRQQANQAIQDQYKLPKTAVTTANVIGEMAPYMLLPGGVTGGALKRGLTRSALGAGVAGSAMVDKEKDRVPNMLLGGVLGNIPALVRTGYKALAPARSLLKMGAFLSTGNFGKIGGMLGGKSPDLTQRASRAFNRLGKNTKRALIKAPLVGTASQVESGRKAIGDMKLSDLNIDKITKKLGDMTADKGLADKGFIDPSTGKPMNPNASKPNLKDITQQVPKDAATKPLIESVPQAAREALQGTLTDPSDPTKGSKMQGLQPSTSDLMKMTPEEYYKKYLSTPEKQKQMLDKAKKFKGGNVTKMAQHLREINHLNRKLKDKQTDIQTALAEAKKTGKTSPVARLIIGLMIGLLFGGHAMAGFAGAVAKKSEKEKKSKKEKQGSIKKYQKELKRIKEQRRKRTEKVLLQNMKMSSQ